MHLKTVLFLAVLSNLSSQKQQAPHLERLNVKCSISLFKFSALFGCILLVLLIFAVSSLLAMISKSAHKCYPLLYSILMTRSLTYRQRLRIESMISRLSGPVIGFYCLDLFAVNSYEFSQLILISVANYLFIIGLFQ